MIKNSFRFLIPFLAWPGLFFGCTHSSRHYEVQKLNFNHENLTVDVSRYADKQPAPKSLLIMPPTGGSNYIDRSYARLFANAGYDVYIVEQWTGMNEKSTDLELHQRLYQQGQDAIALVLDQIKSPTVGLLGTSVGALHAAVAASLQPRLKGVFAIVGGAPIREVIVTSDQKAMAQLKAARYARYKFKNDEEYTQALERAFSLEPLNLGDGFRGKALGIAIATEDETVPTKTQNQLLQFWTPSKVITFSSSHFWGIVRTWWSKENEVLEFFENIR